MKQSESSLLEFPCEFPIKVMGVATQDFESLVTEIVRQHADRPVVPVVRSRLSRGGKYVSITVTIEAHSQSELDSIYRALSAHERIMMAL